MKRKNKAVLTLFAFLLVGVMSISSAFTVLAAPPTQIGKVTSGEGDTVVSSGTTGLNTMDYVDPEYLSETPHTFKADDKVVLIVEMDEKSLVDKFDENRDKYDTYQDYLSSTSGRIAAQNMLAKQNSMLKSIGKNVDYALKYNYTSVINGFAIEIEYQDRALVDAVASSAAGSMIAERYETPDATIVINDVVAYDTGIFDSSDVEYQGEGMLVGILDTGLDYEHPAFSTENLPMKGEGDEKEIDYKRLKETRESIKTVVNSGLLAAGSSTTDFTGSPYLTVSDVFVNEKVPYAYDYADRDAQVNTHIDNMHGTHVAGIVAGRSDDPKDANGQPMYDDKGKLITGITGVAPLAQLAIFKVFSDIETGAQTENIVAAIEDCAVLGVDVINMSLGSDCGFTTEEDSEPIKQIAYDRLTTLGISLVVAASNSYSSGFQSHWGLNYTSSPDSATVGAPSTYKAAISVASISGVFSQFLQAVDTSGKELGVAYFDESAHVNSESYEFVKDVLKVVDARRDEPTIKSYITKFKDDNNNGVLDDGEEILEVKIPYMTIPGTGDNVNYAGKDVDDKIALVARGTLSFEDKIKNARNNGAIACVVYNNVAGVIRMQVGDEIKLPSCSISLDAANQFKNNSNCYFVINSEAKAGPFMSEFSSWGPTPDLKMKPEITAHGGEIYSSIPGGGYERMSGTSMASPNMAGVVTLMRQHMKKHAEQFGLYNDGTKVIDYTKLEARIYQVLMSTTTIALNQEGNPYAVRKQGSGLANLFNAVNTDSFIVTREAPEEGQEKGEVMHKTKLELGDDPDKTGVYDMNFEVVNTGAAAHTYDLGYYVMTESVSTNEVSVAEKSHMFTDSAKAVTVTGGTYADGKLTVTAGSTASVNVKLTLTAAEKKYIDDNFENGMYVEGFIMLDDKTENGIDLDVPFLAFYGDWTDSDIFDYTLYEQSEDDDDDSIKEKDKRYSNSMPVTLYGKLTENGSDGALPLSDFVFYTPETPVEYEKPVAEEDKAAMSFNERSLYELYYFAGFQRGAKKVDYFITNDYTGEVLYENTCYDARKRIGAVLEQSPAEWGCVNGGKYTIHLRAWLDWDKKEKYNDVEMSFYMDSDSPVVVDSEIRIEEDRNKETRHYLDLYVYDNHYVNAMNFLIYNERNGQYESIYDQGLRPITGGRNTTTKVTYDLTDYWYQLQENDYKVKVMIYDCAFNYTWYNMDLSVLNPGAEKVYFGDFGNYTDFTNANGDTITVLSSYNKDKFNRDENGQIKKLTEINIVPDEVLDLREALVSNPEIVWDEDIQWKASGSKISINDKGVMIGLSPGVSHVTVTIGDVAEVLTVNVLSSEKIEEYNVKVKTDPRRLGGVKLDEESEQYKNTSKEMFAGEKYVISASLDPYYINGKDNYIIEWTSNNNSLITVKSFPNDPYKAIVTANSSTFDKNGDYLSNNYGLAMVTAQIYNKNENGEKGTATAYSSTINFNVLEEFVVEGDKLTEYNGIESDVNIPGNKSIKTIGDRCFLYNPTIENVVIPEGVETVGYASFAYCSNLRSVVFPSTLQVIDGYAFAAYIEDGVPHTKLETADTTAVVKPLEIRHHAFVAQNVLGVDADKAAQGTYEYKDCKLDLSMARTVGEFAFYFNMWMTEVDLTNCTYIGVEAFEQFGYLAAANTQQNKFNRYVTATFGEHNVFLPRAFAISGLRDVTLPMNRIGDNAFYNSIFINNLTFIGQDVYIGKAAFMGIQSLQTVTFETSVEYIGQFAFCALIDGNYIKSSLNKIEFNSTCKRIDSYAFAYSVKVTSVTLPAGLEYLGEGAFVQSGLTKVNIHSDCKLTNINGDAFTLCDSLKDYTGSSDTLSTDKGCLLSADGTTLIAVPVGMDLSSYSLPGRITSIAPFAFASNSTIENIDLSNVVTLGEGAFMNCEKLQSVTVPEGLETIGDYTFAGCPELNEMDLSGLQHLASVGAYAFSKCGIQSLKLPDSVKTIGKYAFSESKLTSFKVPAGVTEIAPHAFEKAALLETVQFHNGITQIGANAFASTALKNISAAQTNGVLKIGKFAFAYITTLDSASFNNVTEIGDAAFQATHENVSDGVNITTSLTKFSAPKATYIGNAAFLYQYQLGDGIANKFDIPSVEYLDSYALGYTANENFKGDKLTYIGAYALEGNKFDTFEIGAKVEYVGPGVFMDSKVESIDVNAGNKVYQSIDGVLYKNLPDGLELTAYPFEKKDVIQYEVVEGTTRVGEAAFFGVPALRAVTLPESLLSIGNVAFFGTPNLVVYKFLSASAPALESTTYYYKHEYTSGNSSRSDRYAYWWQGYANFYDSFTQTNYSDRYMYSNITRQDEDDVFSGINDSIIGGGFTGVDYGLVMISPKNGIGYDNFIYSHYFSIKEEGGEYLEDATQEVISLIAGLKEAAEITLTDKNAVNRARTLYDSLKSFQQKAFVTNLVKLEAAEARIAKLEADEPNPDEPNPDEPNPDDPGKDTAKGCGCGVIGGSDGTGGIAALVIALTALAAMTAVIIVKRRKTSRNG